MMVKIYYVMERELISIYDRKLPFFIGVLTLGWYGNII
jgi:hypothetical protein